MMIESVVVNLKARLQPMHRHDLEDAFLAYCENRQLALDIVGGGTLVDDETGEPLACDIEIGGTDDYQITDHDIEKIACFFDENFAPKGSSLKIYHKDVEVKTMAIGHLEGLSLMLNGLDLPDGVYQDCDINYVVDKCNELMGNGEIGLMHSYNENHHTYLYFYGSRFEQMKNAIIPFIDEYPLCQKSEIKQIA